MGIPFIAAKDVLDILQEVKEKNHPRLAEASIALSFVDSKPFVKDRLNWGKVKKFSNQAKLWQNKKYDFEITLCADVWYQILTESQRPAIIDLHLSRIRPEYLPEVVTNENGKKKILKDEFGRTKYTSEVKIDEKTGESRWIIDPLDLIVFAENVRRYGLWYDDIVLIESAIDQSSDFLSHGSFIPNADVAFHVNVPPAEEDVSYDYYLKTKN